MKRSRAAIGTALVTSTLTSLAMLATAPAAHASVSAEPLASGLAGPLQMDIDEERLVVAESFAGLLTEVTDGGTEVLHGEEGFEIAGVAIEDGDIAFLTTKNQPEDEDAPYKPAAFLKVLSGEEVTTVANLRKHEKETNPDGDVRYGFTALTKACEDKLPPFLQSYKGIVDAHPYGLADAPGGGWYVADAAGNSILKVKPNGNIKTVAVLPSQKIKVTKAMAKDQELPGCVVGHKYGFEAVPTDVEVAKNGSLVVSLLPGGPEDDSLGKRGKVVRVDPDTGKAKTLAKGFLGAANVAIGEGGAIYVAELMGGKITKVDDGGKSAYYKTSTPAAVEFAYGYVYASEGAMNFEEGGSVVKLMELD